MKFKNTIVALTLLATTCLILPLAQADKETTSLFYDATSKECYKQFTADKELNKYPGMTDSVCPCLLRYLKGHYNDDDIVFITDVGNKIDKHAELTKEESTRNETLLNVATEAGGQCATEYFSAHPAN